MLQDGSLKQDFRFRGFPNQSMQSPRQPITAPIADDRRRNEEKFVKVFGRSHELDPATDDDDIRSPKERDQKDENVALTYRRLPPQDSGMNVVNGNWMPMPAPQRSDQHAGGFQYGSDSIDNSPRPRGMRNPFNEKTSADRRMLQQFREEANSDIDKFKQEKKMIDFDREERRRHETEIQDKYYPWDRLKEGHGAPKGENDNRRRKFWEDNSRNTVTYAREPHNPPSYSQARGHDLFLNTLGGPGGTVVRSNGGPGLTSQNPRSYASPDRRELDMAERAIQQEKAKVAELRKELEFLKSPRGQDAFKTSMSPDKFQPAGGYEPSFGSKDSQQSRVSRQDYEFRQEEKRSLDLEATRGGAGAPLKDDRGKTITRYPITISVDTTGGHKIQERIPGKRYRLPDEPVYDPFGKPGGGAPMVDRYGKRKTNIYGNFEKTVDDEDVHKKARSKEVMLNELKVGSEEHRRQRDEELRRLKAPASDLAEIIRSKEVGQPKRDPITGSLANQHLPNSDVSKLKMNYQPVEDEEKRRLNKILKNQVEENKCSRQLELYRKRQEANQHFQNFDQTWGHFGGGAPKDKIQRKKVNLDNALYHYDRESKSEGTPRDGPRLTGIGLPSKPLNEQYRKRYFEEDIRHQSPDNSLRYIKNTTHSTSKNLYEYPTDKSPRNAQLGPAPYATGSTNAY